MHDFQFHLPDMTCGHRVAAVTTAVKALDGDAVVDIELAAHTLRVQSKLGHAALAQALDEAGYPPAAGVS